MELRADDLEWSYGMGTPVVGPAQALVLVVSGRLLPAGRLHGEAAARASQNAERLLAHRSLLLRSRDFPPRSPRPVPAGEVGHTCETKGA